MRKKKRKISISYRYISPTPINSQHLVHSHPSKFFCFRSKFLKNQKTQSSKSVVLFPHFPTIQTNHKRTPKKKVKTKKKDTRIKNPHTCPRFLNLTKVSEIPTAGAAVSAAIDLKALEETESLFKENAK